MFRRAMLVASVIGLVGLAFARTASADVQTITGIVKAAVAHAQEAATVKVGTVVYKVTKDDNGRTVATEAKDKKVEMKGNVEEKDGVKWITVISCKIVE